MRRTPDPASQENTPAIVNGGGSGQNEDSGHPATLRGFFQAGGISGQHQAPGHPA